MHHNKVKKEKSVSLTLVLVYVILLLDQYKYIMFKSYLCTPAVFRVIRCDVK